MLLDAKWGCFLICEFRFGISWLLFFLFLTAIQELQFVVSFPLITIGPGIVATICGIVLFGEIEGRRNFLFLGGSIFVTIIAVTMIVISKVGV